MREIVSNKNLNHLLRKRQVKKKFKCLAKPPSMVVPHHNNGINRFLLKVFRPILSSPHTYPHLIKTFLISFVSLDIFGRHEGGFYVFLLLIFIAFYKQCFLDLGTFPKIIITIFRNHFIDRNFLKQHMLSRDKLL